MAVARIEDTVEGRLERLERLLVAVAEQQAAILDLLSSPQVGWLDVQAAALFLSTSPRSIRYAHETGRLVGHKNGAGRLLFSREALDKFATANDAAYT